MAAEIVYNCIMQWSGLRGMGRDIDVRTESNEMSRQGDVLVADATVLFVFTNSVHATMN